MQNCMYHSQHLLKKDGETNMQPMSHLVLTLSYNSVHIYLKVVPIELIWTSEQTCIGCMHRIGLKRLSPVGT